MSKKNFFIKSQGNVPQINFLYDQFKTTTQTEVQSEITKCNTSVYTYKNENIEKLLATIGSNCGKAKLP